MELLFSTISLISFSVLLALILFDMWKYKYISSNIILLIACILYVIFQARYIYIGDYNNGGAEWGMIETIFAGNLIYHKIKQIYNAKYKYRQFIK